MRFKPLDSLIRDDILAENIVNINSQTLLKKNTKLTAKLAERIKGLGFNSVYVKTPEEDALIEEEVKDIINPEIRRKAIYVIKECVDIFKDGLSKQKQQLMYGDAGQALIKTIDSVAESLIDELLNSDDLKISIMDIKTETHYMYEHAINTAVLAIMLSVKSGLSSMDMKNVAIASLLANVGYTQISPEIYDHENPLTREQLEIINTHPKVGYDILANNTNLNAHIKSIVIQHHERINGSGYPFGLKSAEIHPLTKIVMLADVYDAMTSDRKHRKAFAHNEVLEYIMGNAGTLFDFDLANTFSRCIIPYPAGAYVKLSNGIKAIVIRNNPSHPLRPVLRAFSIHGLLDNSPEGYIDLMEKHNLTIECILYE